MTPEEKLKELGYELTEHKAFTPAMAVGKITGNLLFLSGTTPPARDGKVWQGRLGETYSVEEGYQAARECAVAQSRDGENRARRSQPDQSSRQSARHDQLRARLRRNPASHARLFRSPLRGARRCGPPRPICRRHASAPIERPDRSRDHLRNCVTVGSDETGQMMRRIMESALCEPAPRRVCGHLS